MLQISLNIIAILLGVGQFALLFMLTRLGLKGVLDAYGGKVISIKRLNQYIADPHFYKYQFDFKLIKWVLISQIVNIAIFMLLAIIAWTQ
ncbi:MAG: hypothetical protein PSX81_10375 [bacterium]|nr:hypothetical protein [bacterium]